MQFAGLYLLAALTVAALVYVQVLFFHFILKSRPKGRDYLLMLCMAVVLLLVFFSCRLLGYERLWPLLFLTLYAFSLARSLHPKAKVWEGLLAMAVLVAGVASFCALNVVEARLLAKLFLPWTGGTESLWGIGESPWLLWLLTFCSILLLSGAYLLYGRMIAKGGGVTFRSLFGRGVAALWILFVVMYLASFCIGISSMRDFRKAQKELEAYWGFPVNNDTLLQLYNKSGRIDKSFWEEMNRQDVNFPEFYKKYDGADRIVGTPNAVLPPDIHAEWKAAFNASAELRRIEEIFDAPPPLPERRTNFDFDNFHFDMFSIIRTTVRLELWRVKLSLEENDIDASKKALWRIDNLCVPLVADYNEVSGMVWGAIEPMRATALCHIISSGLADEPWLREQHAILLEKERQIPDVHRRMILGYAAGMMNMLDTLLENTSYATFLFAPESWGLIGREGAVLARCHCISDFSDFPEHPNGIFAAMLSRSLRILGKKKIPQLVATLRVSRCLVEAEQARLKTGSFPSAADDLPEDPFTGKPLMYAVGDYEITEEHFVLNEEEEENDETAIAMTKEMQKMLKEMQNKLGVTDEWAKEMQRRRKYAFKTQRRTVKAVRIWSVGPDGLSGDVPEGNSRNSRDDIRFFVTF